MAIQETISECKNYPKSDKPAESGATQFATYESSRNKQKKEEEKKDQVKEYGSFSDIPSYKEPEDLYPYTPGR